MKSWTLGDFLTGIHVQSYTSKEVQVTHPLQFSAARLRLSKPQKLRGK
jgi:hypothetical protein